jgi:hypothetical protein
LPPSLFNWAICPECIWVSGGIAPPFSPLHWMEVSGLLHAHLQLLKKLN